MLWCYAQSNRSFHSKSSPLFTCKISRPTNSLNKSYFNDYSKWEAPFLYLLYVTFLRSWRFEKTFCQTGAADIQDYEPAQNVFTWIFLHTIHYYGEALFSSLHLGIDSRLFVVNLMNLKSVDVLFWCITHCTTYIIYLEEIQTKSL